METSRNVNNENSENNENKITHEKSEPNENNHLVSNNNKSNNDNYIESAITISKNEEIKNISNNNIIKGLLTNLKPYYFYAKIGKTYTFIGDKDGSPYIVIGPHWNMYVGFCSIMSLVYIVFLRHYWPYLNILFKLSGLICFLTYLISYTYIFLVNPGIPKYDENAILGKPREKYSFCKKCGIWKNMDKNVYHCFDCDVCIEGYDHHCPWTGKCIAKKNVNIFYIFLVSILAAFGYFVTALTHAQHNIYLEKRKNLIKKFL